MSRYTAISNRKRLNGVLSHNQPPWFSGFYERLVGSVKREAAIRNRILLRDEFHTFVTKAEAVVNCRPLIYLPDELNDHRVLRPMNFLIVDAKCGTPTIPIDMDDPEFHPDGEDSKEKVLKFWRKSQRALEKILGYMAQRLPTKLTRTLCP